MFEKTKESVREWLGVDYTQQVYLGTESAFIDQIVTPLMSGAKKNTFNSGTDAEKISTVSTCLKILSDTIARLPLHVLAETERGNLPDKIDYRYPFLHYSPDGIINSYSFFNALEYNRNLKGNSFALIGRNPNTGKVTGLHFVPSVYFGHPKMVNGSLYYPYAEIQEDGSKKEKRINSEDVLHFKTATKDSFWGINPIEIQRMNMSTLWKSGATIDNFYENNAFSPLALKSSIPDAAFQKVVIEGMAKFKTVNVGVGQAGSVITLPPFTELQQLQLNVIDEKFILSQKFTGAQIASWFGIPGNMVGIYEYSKINNAEQFALDFRSLTIAAIAKMYRTELEFKLLSEEERVAGKSIEFALTALIELDTATKMAYYKAMKNELGVLTSNQIALFEGLPTFEGGDERVMSKNYAPTTGVPGTMPGVDPSAGAIADPSTME